MPDTSLPATRETPITLLNEDLSREGQWLADSHEVVNVGRGLRVVSPLRI